MGFYELIKNRHSVRAFSENPVEPEKLRRILAAMERAPSAGNLQSYKVYIVRSEDARKDLVPACSYQEFLSQAPAVLVFCADQKQAESKYEQRGFELYSIQDATIACAYAQLAIEAEGLATVWVGGFDPLEVSRIIQAMPFEVPVAILPIGYAAEKPEPTGRKPLKQVVKEI
ncbi:MAG: nitroreductase family protein [Candidatus Micrarchaeota archaeon]